MGTLKYLWQCLYKNQAIIDGRKRKWWLAVIVFILSIALLMIPILSSGYMTSGGAVLEPSNEKGISIALDTLSSSNDAKYADFQKLNFQDTSDGIQLFYGDNTSYVDSQFFTDTTIDNGVRSETNKYNFKHRVTIYNTTTNTDGSTSHTSAQSEEFVYFSVYSTKNDITTKEGSTAVNASIARINSTDNKTGTAYHSFILFAPKSYMVVLYPNAPVDLDKIANKSANAPSGSSMSGLYSGLSPLLKDNKFSLKYTMTGAATLENTASNVLWKDLFAQGYRPIRDQNTWVMVGIVAGSGVGLIILGGIVLWLFTLGKSNLLHKNCNAWEGIQMSIMSSFTVCLLAMIFFFFSSSYGIMIGVFGYIMRLTFLINRTSGKFNSTKEQKPLYQSRS